MERAKQRDRDRQTERERNRETDRQKDRHKDRQTNRMTMRKICFKFLKCPVKEKGPRFVTPSFGLFTSIFLLILPLLSSFFFFHLSPP